MLLNALIAIGLSTKEALVYMMLLRRGCSPVSTLAKRLNMKRVSIYAVLESLMQKGYVNYEKKETCRYYYANDPICILDELERNHAQLKIKFAIAKECIHSLRLFAFDKNQESKPKVSNLELHDSKNIPLHDIMNEESWSFLQKLLEKLLLKSDE